MTGNTATLTGENRFVFIVPMYNASETLARMLHSVCGQSYSNWNVILIDDCSLEEHKKTCDEIIYNFQRTMGDSLSSILANKKPRIKTFWNSQKRWEVDNVLFGISMCESNDIVCRLDADDWLTDLDALAMIDVVYQKHNVDCLWTAHRWGFSDRNISAPLPPMADPYVYPWVTSHLKTFRKHLLDKIPYENFLNMDGELVKRAGDQCLYLPVLRNAKRRVFFPKVVYHYTIDEQGGAVYQTADAHFQKSEADFLRSRGYVESGIAWEDAQKTINMSTSNR